MPRVHPDCQRPLHAVAAPRVYAAGRRDHIRPRQMTQRVLIDGVPLRVANPPPAVFPPLPPGPADPQPVGLVEGRVGVGQCARLGQVVTELADPERRRDFRRLFDPLLNALVQEGRVTRPEGRDQRALVEVRAVDQIGSLEVNHDGVHREQQDAFDDEQVVRIHGADRLDRFLEHRPEVVLVEDAGWDRQRMGFVEDVVARDPGVVFEARGHRLPGSIEVLLPVGREPEVGVGDERCRRQRRAPGVLRQRVPVWDADRSPSRCTRVAEARAPA